MFIKIYDVLICTLHTRSHSVPTEDVKPLKYFILLKKLENEVCMCTVHHRFESCSILNAYASVCGARLMENVPFHEYDEKNCGFRLMARGTGYSHRMNIGTAKFRGTK